MSARQRVGALVLFVVFPLLIMGGYRYAQHQHFSRYSNIQRMALLVLLRPRRPDPSSFRVAALTREELGRATWAFLHTMASVYPETPTARRQQMAVNLISALYAPALASLSPA
jgi:hypothetical protein